MKVMRGKDHLKNKPTGQEIASFRATQENERQFEDLIPKHVPLKIKIRKEKEKEFKDLNNERWARDFELEVTNTGHKPIYSLSLLLVTDVKAAAGFRIVAPLNYGKLGEITVKAEPEDIPIKPGEIYIFKIHPGQLDAWDTIGPKENRPHPKKIQVKIEALSFGDGTGLVGEDGEAIPHAPYERSGLNSCGDQPNRGGPLVGASDAAPPGKRPRKASTAFLPASFLPVNFLSTNRLNSNSVGTEPQSNLSCQVLQPAKQGDCCRRGNMPRRKWGH